MATKSFTTTLKFNKKSVDSLIEALENEKKPNLSEVGKISIVRDKMLIKKMFDRAVKRG